MNFLAKKLMAKAKGEVETMVEKSVETLNNQQTKISEPSNDEKPEGTLSPMDHQKTEEGGQEKPGNVMVISQETDGDD